MMSRREFQTDYSRNIEKERISTENAVEEIVGGIVDSERIDFFDESIALRMFKSSETLLRSYLSLVSTSAERKTVGYSLGEQSSIADEFPEETNIKLRTRHGEIVYQENRGEVKYRRR